MTKWVVKEITRTHHLIMLSENSEGTVAVVWNKYEAALVGSAPEMRDLLAQVRDTLDTIRTTGNTPVDFTELAERCRLLVKQADCA